MSDGWVRPQLNHLSNSYYPSRRQQGQGEGTQVLPEQMEGTVALSPKVIKPPPPRTNLQKPTTNLPPPPPKPNGGLPPPSRATSGLPPPGPNFGRPRTDEGKTKEEEQQTNKLPVPTPSKPPIHRRQPPPPGSTCPIIQLGKQGSLSAQLQQNLQSNELECNSPGSPGSPGGTRLTVQDPKLAPGPITLDTTIPPKLIPVTSNKSAPILNFPQPPLPETNRPTTLTPVISRNATASPRLNMPPQISSPLVKQASKEDVYYQVQVRNSFSFWKKYTLSWNEADKTVLIMKNPKKIKYKMNIPKSSVAMADNTITISTGKKLIFYLQFRTSTECAAVYSKIKFHSKKLLSNISLLEFDEAAIMSDIKGRILRVNQKFIEMFGYSKEDELIGQNVKILMETTIANMHDGLMSNHAKTGQRKLIGKKRNVNGKNKQGKLFKTCIQLGETMEIINKKSQARLVAIFTEPTVEEDNISDREENDPDVIKNNEDIDWDDDEDDDAPSTSTPIASGQLLKQNSMLSRGSVQYSAGLACGFMSLIQEEAQQLKATPKKSNVQLSIPDGTVASLQSAKGIYSPLFATEGVIKKKSKGSWKEYFACCGLAGIFILKTSPDTPKIKRKFPLKKYSVFKLSGPDFVFVVRDNDSSKFHYFKALSEEEYYQWLTTLAQYTIEMYSYVPLDKFEYPTMIWNSRNLIIKVNSEFEKLVTANKEHLLGKNIDEILPPDKCKSNQAIYNYTHQISNKVLLGVVTIVSKLNEDLYLLTNFGELIESGDLRYIAYFKPTGTKKDSYRFREDMEIKWICSSKEVADSELSDVMSERSEDPTETNDQTDMTYVDTFNDSGSAAVTDVGGDSDHDDGMDNTEYEDFESGMEPSTG